MSPNQILFILFGILNATLAILEAIAIPLTSDFYNTCSDSWQSMILTCFIHICVCIVYIFIICGACLQLNHPIPDETILSSMLVTFTCVWVVSIIHFAVCGLFHMCKLPSAFTMNLMTTESVLFIIYTIAIGIYFLYNTSRYCYRVCINDSYTERIPDSIHHIIIE